MFREKFQLNRHLTADNFFTIKTKIFFVIFSTGDY